jgi:hypothetical protein
MNMEKSRRYLKKSDRTGLMQCRLRNALKPKRSWMLFLQRVDGRECVALPEILLQDLGYGGGASRGNSHEAHGAGGYNVPNPEEGTTGD